MSGHELALQKALLAHLRSDPALQALLGDPAHIQDGGEADGVFPRLSVGRSESRPVNADGGGILHLLSLTVASRFQGTEEAKAILAATRLRLTDARLEADGVRTVSLGVTFADVFSSADRARTYAVLRVRAVTEEI